MVIHSARSYITYHIDTVLARNFHRIISIKKLSEQKKAELRDVKWMAKVRETAYADFSDKCTKIVCECEAETESSINAINAKKDEQVSF